jgi:DNA repair protein RecN (Recombination protein N)
MLKRLSIQSLGLFEDVELRFAPGFNVLTGETGAGKSLILSALGLVLGARASGDAVRSGAGSARIEAEFTTGSVSLGAGDSAAPERGGRGLRITRIVRPSGRSAYYLDAHPVARAQISAAGRALVQFALQDAQHEVGSHAAFLDALDVLAEQGALRADYASAHAELTSARQELDEVHAALRAQRAGHGRIEDQIASLEELRPQPGERREIVERLQVLERARQYLELAAHVKLALRDREQPIEDELAALVRAANRAPSGTSSVRNLVERLHVALSDVEECVRAAERLELDLDIRPAELEALKTRRSELERVGESFGIDPDGLAEHLDALRAGASEREVLEQRAAALAERLDAVRSRARSLALVLHSGRTAHARDLERRIEAELSELCLQDARIRVELTTSEAAPLAAAGVTELCVRFAANPGERYGLLSEVASGGERSRLLLALSCLGLQEDSGTLVLDETDAGLGGIAAEAVALRLSRLGQSRQLICVTHQARIAAAADAHFRVMKTTASGRTRASVDRLATSERIPELSRMLAGGSFDRAAQSLALELVRSMGRGVPKTAA